MLACRPHGCCSSLKGVRQWLADEGPQSHILSPFVDLYMPYDWWSRRSYSAHFEAAPGLHVLWAAQPGACQSVCDSKPPPWHPSKLPAACFAWRQPAMAQPLSCHSALMLFSCIGLEAPLRAKPNSKQVAVPAFCPQQGKVCPQQPIAPLKACVQVG